MKTDNRKQKHYIGKIKVRVGEYDTDYAFRFKTVGNPDNYVAKVAKTWYGDDAEREDDVYYFDGGCVAVTPNCWRCIDKATYDAVGSIIHEL